VLVVVFIAVKRQSEELIHVNVPFSFCKVHPLPIPGVNVILVWTGFPLESLHVAEMVQFPFESTIPKHVAK
jgi:hypothetical protein